MAGPRNRSSQKASNPKDVKTPESGEKDLNPKDVKTPESGEKDLNPKDVKTPESGEKDSSLIKDLRKKISQSNSTIKSLQKELDLIHQQESDKGKTLEEKIANLRLENENLKKDSSMAQKKYELEKELLKANVNQEFVDLMLSKGIKTEDEIDVIVDNLKSSYPSAFVTEEPKKPIGKVGTSQTNSKNLALSKKEVAEIITDPTKVIDSEIKKMAQEYGLI